MHLVRVTLVVLWKLGCKVVRLEERDQSEERTGADQAGQRGWRAGFKRHLESQFCYPQWLADRSCSIIKCQWARGDLTS